MLQRGGNDNNRGGGTFDGAAVKKKNTNCRELPINYSLQFTLTGKHPDPQQRIRSNEWWVSGEVSDEVIKKHLTIGKADKQGDSPCFGEVLPHF